MTRKDYIEVAESLREAYKAVSDEQKHARFSSVNMIIDHLATTLAPNNPNYNRQRFIDIVQAA